MKQILDRLKNKAVLSIISVAIYQILKEQGIVPSLENYQMWVDTGCYVLLGYGVYGTFQPKLVNDEGNEG